MFQADKVVSYKYESVTFLLSHAEFLTSIVDFATEYKNDRPTKYPRSSYRTYKNAKKKSLKVLNSIIDKLNEQIKTSDTVFILHKPLDNRTAWRWRLNNIIISQIEKNNCAIIDANNDRQLVIIRVKGAWGSFSRAGGGGRRYYFSRNKDYFIDKMDWIQ